MRRAEFLQNAMGDAELGLLRDMVFREGIYGEKRWTPPGRRAMKRLLRRLEQAEATDVSS